MANFKDFEDDKGKVDWTAYHKRRKDIGEECFECGRLIHLDGIDAPGHPEKCRDCNDMSVDKEEVTHEDFIRCPACRNQMRIIGGNDFDCYDAGEHEIMCDECEFEFEITTDVTYTFTSPAMLEKKD